MFSVNVDAQLHYMGCSGREGGGNGGRKKRKGMGGEEYVISLSFDKSKINDCVASHKIGLLSIQ